jgi:ribonuclease P protein component
MPGAHTFRKNERLCSKAIIEALFNHSKSFLVYPVKVVYLELNDQLEKFSDSPLQAMMSVSKKKFRKAAQRNKIKRLMRESYRMNKNELTSLLCEKNKKVAVGLIFIGDAVPDFSYLQSKIILVIKRLSQELSQIN